jgi:hypothetical protein
MTAPNPNSTPGAATTTLINLPPRAARTAPRPPPPSWPHWPFLLRTRACASDSDTIVGQEQTQREEGGEQVGRTAPDHTLTA